MTTIPPKNTPAPKSPQPSIIAHFSSFVNKHLLTPLKKHLITPIKNLLNPPTIIRITHAPGSSVPLKTPIIKNATPANQKLLKQLEKQANPRQPKTPFTSRLKSHFRSHPYLIPLLGAATILFVAILSLIIFRPAREDTPPEDPATTADRLADEQARAYAEKYPIMKDLPILHAEYSKDYTTYTEYRIDGGDFSQDKSTPCPRDFCLKITDITGGNRATALAHLRSLGYRPEDYHILYQHTPIIPLD